MSIFGNQQELDLTLFVDNKLIFKNPQSGRIKKVKVGFSFPCFLFDWIALLIKGLTGHGLFVLAFNFAATIIMAVVNAQSDRYGRYGVDTDTALAVSIFFFFTWLGLKIVYGVEANKLQAKDLLERGWILQNADAAKEALKRQGWNLASNADAENGTKVAPNVQKGMAYLPEENAVEREEFESFFKTSRKEAGDTNAYTQLAEKAKAGVTDAQNELAKKARAGDANAQYEYGLMYESGHGRPQNLKEAYYWFQLAAEQGHKDAKKALARI